MRKSELAAIVAANGLVVEGSETVEELAEALRHLAASRTRERSAA